MAMLGLSFSFCSLRLFFSPLSFFFFVCLLFILCIYPTFFFQSGTLVAGIEHLLPLEKKARVVSLLKLIFVSVYFVINSHFGTDVMLPFFSFCCMYLCVCVCMCMRIGMYMCVCMYVYVCMCMRVYVCV